MKPRVWVRSKPYSNEIVAMNLVVVWFKLIDESWILIRGDGSFERRTSSYGGYGGEWEPSGAFERIEDV